MNIQQYYRSAANVSLNASLAAIIPAVLLLIAKLCFSINIPLVFLVLPFILYSLICYQNFIIQHRRSIEAKVGKPKGTTTLTDEEQILVTFLPAPSLRMLLFDQDGCQIGEIRDDKNSWWRWFLPDFVDRYFPNLYHLYNQKNQLLASYQIIERKKIVKIYDSEKNTIGIYQDSSQSVAMKRTGYLHSYVKNESMIVEGSQLYPSVKVRGTHGEIIAKLIKGWMPVQWGKHFKDANTPYIIFENNLDDHIKILIIGVLTEIFRYTKH